jgi:hypothetical protein
VNAGLVRHLNDDRGPLTDLLSCIACNEIIEIERSAPTLKAATSSDIVAGGAIGLSGCDWSADGEMRGAEAKGE